ncbi:hypothetical protein FB566_3989 [Stackebrandtia endophytica]|uniref:Peptide zinc metalloprotease protein n=1 Tax=Stackebrandtia endophytica TaxID=1496996 RepID=A0A543B0P2_9ACTN|nr:hypothetical protein [Stackebrandtia endophytica]TQL78403.1 hypothetical protein FB566_3989 [Stackebrandtia endophytica]
MSTTDSTVTAQPVVFHHLTFLDEGDEVTVGRPDIDDYVHLPSDGAALLRRLVDGDTPDQAARWYHSTYGETVDMTDFLDTLNELGFIADDPAEVVAAPTVRWQRLGAAVFSRWSLIPFTVAVVAMIVILTQRPDLIPHYSHAFYTPSLIVVMLTLFLGQFPFLFLHEFAHALAGRRLGLKSRLRVSRRFYFIVFETSMDGLVSVPRTKRYLPILAGMMSDLLATAVLICLAAWAGGLVAGVAMALALGTVMRMLWQCYFFLRTDLYYLVVTVLGCKNLHATSRDLLQRRIRRLFGRTVPEPLPAAEVDRKAARWYSWLLLLGYAAMIFSVGYVVVPSLVFVTVEVVTRISQSAPVPMVIDSLVVAVLVIGQFVVAGLLGIRERRLNRSPN